MKGFLLNLIISLLKRISSPQLVTHIQSLVLTLMDLEIPGREKRAKLLDMLEEAYGEVAQEISKAAPHVINLIIEGAVAWAKHKYA